MICSWVPYNWSSQAVGFTNFATLAGIIIGLATSGPLSDWISMRATKPEMRLPTMIPYVIIAVLGNFTVAFGYQYHWDWQVCSELYITHPGSRHLSFYQSKYTNKYSCWVIVIVGYTCAGIQVAALPATASTYAVDSYKPVVGSIFVAITVNKNLWGYGFSKFITPWTESAGYLPAIMTNMCLTVLWCSFGFLFYFAGKNYFRKWTANSSIWTLDSQ